MTPPVPALPHNERGRVLFATGDPSHGVLPPLLAREQLNCGPGWSDSRAPDGRIRELATPNGNFDLAAVTEKLPAGEEPEVVACFIEPARGYFPRNLAAFKCPRVALVAGTHRGKSPLLDLLRYLGEEPFDRVVLVEGRHHAPFLHAAGYRNVAWFPGLMFPHTDAAVRAARRATREAQLAWAEDAAGASPRAERLRAGLAARRLPFDGRAVDRSAVLEFFGASSVGVHASDNGELGVRFFEILAAGAAVLADRLPPESGFEQLFLEGREAAAFGSAAELANRASELLVRPDEARAIGAAGARWFDEILSERWRRDAFRSLAFDGMSLPEFEFTAAETTRVFFGGNTDRLQESIEAYESVQESHRTQETVRVGIDRETPEEIVTIFSTLPRVALGRLDERVPADIAIVSRRNLDGPAVAQAARRWIYDDAAVPGCAIDEIGRDAVEPAGLREWVKRADSHEVAGLTGEAEAVLREAAERFGDTGGAGRALGDFFKRCGRLTEAMIWHRRSVGCANPGQLRSVHRRRRVLFIVQHGPAWPGLASVHAAFDADPAWETVVIGMPFDHPDYTTDAQRNAVFTFLRKQKIPYVRWDEFPLGVECADLAFLPDADERTRPAGWHAENLVKHGVRLAYVPEDLDPADGENEPLGQHNQPRHQLAWGIFSWSEAHKGRFRRHCATGDAHVIVTGHPKTDALRKLDAARDPELERFIAGRKAVCWNPHFDVRPDGKTPFGRGCSTFAGWKDFLLREFARRQDLAFIIRPHPLFFAKLARSGVVPVAELEEFVQRCARAGNVHLDLRPSCLPALAASTAMLSDLSSLVLEFAFTGRSVLYLCNPHGPPIEPHVVAEDFCARAETAAEILGFLDQVAAGEDPSRIARRREGFRKWLHLPPEGVGITVKRAVERRLLDEVHGDVPAKTIVAA